MSQAYLQPARFLAGVLLSFSVSNLAGAVDCESLPNPLYFPATTLLEALLSKVSPVLADSARVGDEAITVIHFPLPSCSAYETHRTRTYLPSAGQYYLPDGSAATCEIPTLSELRSDLTAMDVGGVTCLGGENPPGDLVEFPSHVETLGFVVPRNSSQLAITATEAHYLMAYGAERGLEVAPWVNPNFVHVRHAGSSTQLTVGANIGISGTMWSGTLESHQGSGEVRDAIVAENTTGNAEQVIGILNSSKWELASNDIKVLAFQAYNGCLGAVFPDSTSISRDKENVRDGHYPIWTNLRYVLRYNSDGNATSPNGEDAAARAQRFVDLMTGVENIESLDVVGAVIETGNIPTCAMHVQREIDGGVMSVFQHTAPCDCSFLERNGISSGCKTCTESDECDGGACRWGFCEPQ